MPANNAQPSSLRLTSVAEAADYLHCNAKTIRRLIADGSLVGYRLGAKILRVDLNQLDELLTPVQTGGDAA